MKVLYLLDESWDSGLTASALTLVGLLNKNGIDAKVLCRKKSYAESVCKELGFQHFVFQGSWLFSLGKIRQWLRGQGFQVLHSHTGSTHTLSYCLKRDFPEMRLFRTRADARTTKQRWLYSRVLAATDRVIFPSKKLREEFLIAYDYPMNKTRVVYPTIEEEGIRVLGYKGIRASYPVKVTLLGRLDPIKGQEDFIQAASLLVRKAPEVHYEIIGAEKNTKIAHLEKLAKRLGVSSRLRIHGFLAGAARDALMRETSIAVVASRGSEVVSRVTLEWMRLGKPIVATSVGVIPELLRDRETGLLVEPQAPEELAYTLGRTLKDEKLRKDLGEKAKEVFKERFEPSVIFKEHLALYGGRS